MIIIETLAGGDDDHTHTQIAGGNLFKRTKFFYSKEQSSSISYGNYLRKLPTEITYGNTQELFLSKQLFGKKHEKIDLFFD